MPKNCLRLTNGLSPSNECGCKQCTSQLTMAAEYEHRLSKVLVVPVGTATATGSPWLEDNDKPCPDW